MSAYSVLPWYFPNAGMFERGPSDFDHAQRFVASYVWEIPSTGTSGVKRALLGNWTLSGLFSAQTGGPVTIVAGQDRSRTALGKERGVYLGGEAYGPGACLNSAPCVDYLNVGAFGLPAVGEFGNIGKGRFQGPGILNWDMGIFKAIPIHENWRLQFRAEFFNMFNRVNLLDPRVSLSAAGFGSIRGASDPRITQLALKIFF